MRVRFIGDPNDNFSGPDHLKCWGVEFVKGEWTEVEDERFARHSHFETKASRQPRGAKEAPEQEEGA